MPIWVTPIGDPCRQEEEERLLPPAFFSLSNLYKGQLAAVLAITTPIVAHQNSSTLLNVMDSCFAENA